MVDNSKPIYFVAIGAMLIVRMKTCIAMVFTLIEKYKPNARETFLISGLPAQR